MSAAEKNTYAAKPAHVRASAVLHIRSRPVDKAGWRIAAQFHGLSLAAFVVRTLNAAAQPDK